jgi:protein-L-isoaspartate(D-aspartate) O-methyltransferase
MQVLRDSVREQQQMLKAISMDIKQTYSLTGISKLSSAVKKSLQMVPRHEFVDPLYQQLSYVNNPLPLEYGQTISQPFIVALMTEALAIQPRDHVLEIGTGSGYQAAILAQLAAKIFTIEVVPELAEQAQEHFQRLGYHNIHIHIGDGAKGWANNAPFDKVIVTACAKKVPPVLLEQLKRGGRMVIPLGSSKGPQILTRIDKDQDGTITQQPLLLVRFVPFV